jgi:hypothetical protein
MRNASFDSIENTDVIEKEKEDGTAVDDELDEQETPLPPQDTSIPLTDAPLTRGEPRDSTTRGVNDYGVLLSQSAPLQSTQSTHSLPQQESMPPNIIKAALQEDVQATKAVPEKHDEKKSEERREDTELMPTPSPRANMNEATSSIPNLGMSSLVHSQPMPYPDQLYLPPQKQMAAVPFGYAPSPYAIPQHVPSGGRRRITLRLQDDTPPSHARRPSFFFRNRDAPLDAVVGAESVNRGEIAVSWFEGTNSAELQQHVRSSLIRKMGIKGNIKLVDLRIIDETMDPPEGRKSS